MQKIIENKFNNLNLILIFLLVFLSGLPFAFIGGDALHDGLMFKVAIDVWSGKMLFSQTYSYYGIVSPIIHSIFIHFLGDYLYSIRIATLVVYSLTSILLFILWSKFISRWISLISLIFWVSVAPYFYQIFYPWPSVFAMFFQVLTILLYILTLSKKNKYIYVFVGISACFTFFSKQSYALLFLSLIAFEFMLMFLQINKKKVFFKNITLISVGFFVTFLVFIIWIYINQALYDYWLQVIRQGYSVGKIVGGSFMHNFLSYYSRHPFWLLIFGSAFIICINSYWEILKNRKNDNSNLIIFSVSFLSFSSFAQIYPTVDPSHTYWAIAPGFIFIFLIIYKCKKYLKEKFSVNGNIFKISILFLIFIVIILISEPIYTLNRASKTLSDHYLSLKSPVVLDKMRIKNNDAIFYYDINFEMGKFFKSHPDKKFVIDNSDAIYSTFTERSVNVLPIFANFSGYSSGYYNFDDAINKYVIKNKPLVLVESINTKRFKNYHLVKIWKNQKLALIAPDEAE